MNLLRGVAPTPDEVAAVLPGDGIVPAADGVMDRAFDLPCRPEAVWPWIVQLGKERAGWYLPRGVERLVPTSRRALRHVDERFTTLRAGDVVPDWGGKDATFTVAEVEPDRHLVYRSQRGRTSFSWALVLRAADASEATRMHLRLRIGPVRHRRLMETAGGAVDLATIALLAAGLRERLEESAGPTS